MPIFLGGLHNSAGITPAAFISIKSKYMVRDTKLVSERKNIKFNFNSYFPIKTINLMRGFIIAEEDNFEKIYTEKIFNAIWKDGLNMNDPIVINKVLKNIDLNPETFFAKAADEKIKDRLRKLTDDALKKGVFGAPTFLVNKKLAYVDDLTPEEIRNFRGTLTKPGTESPFRNRSAEENADLLERMRAGEFKDGEKSLRAKIDMASPNINLRDPVLYRILSKAHPRTGDTWKIYPMYDFAHGQSDAIEDVTHSLCTLEFEDHRPLYEWFLENLPVLSKPRQYEFSRLNLSHTVLSKR